MKGISLILLFLLITNMINSRPINHIGFIDMSSGDSLNLNQTYNPAFLVDSQILNGQDSLSINDEIPIENADVLPTFPGGEDSLLVFIVKNLNYSNVNPEADVEGKVIVKFVVTKVGKIKDVQLIRGLEPLYDKEVFRIVSLLPDFVPGSKNGHPIASYYTLPIIFRIEK